MIKYNYDENGIVRSTTYIGSQEGYDLLNNAMLEEAKSKGVIIKESSDIKQITND